MSKIPEDRATLQAAHLAERILDEVSSATQDWSAVERLASALAQVAALAKVGALEAAPPEADQRDDRDR